MWRLYEFFKDPSIEPEGGEDVLFECDDGGPRELTPSYLELLKEFAAISATRFTDDDLLSAASSPGRRSAPARRGSRSRRAGGARARYLDVVRFTAVSIPLSTAAILAAVIPVARIFLWGSRAARRAHASRSSECP